MTYMPLKPIPLPSVSVLRATFILTDSGRLINKIGRTSRKRGQYADNHYRRGGYRTVYVAGKLRSAHRVIWKMVYGSDPKYLDHINGDPDDNRPENLRSATHGENMRNTKHYSNNTSGMKGVNQRKDGGMWRAYISVNRRRVWLGQFPTFNEAKQAADLAREKLHGNFARKL